MRLKPPYFVLRDHGKKIKIIFSFISFLLLTVVFPYPSAAGFAIPCGTRDIINSICYSSFYDSNFAINDPCTDAIFNLYTCANDLNPFDTRYTGNQCVPVTWPGYHCESCYWGTLQWSAMACKPDFPTPTPTFTPTPTTIPTPTLTSTPTHTPTPTTTITPAPTVTPIPGIYTIIGNIFTDINNNGIKDPGEDYVGPATITSSAGNPSYASSNGIYQIISLPAGFVTIHFSGPLTTGYSFSYPFPVDQSLTVGVGPCSLLPPNASCPDGNDIETLDISVEIASAAPPWIQSVGTDLRWDKDSSFSNPLPSATTYTSVPATADSMPGIIFSGGKNGVSPSFGTNGGSASQTSWQVGSSAYPDVFTDTHNSIPTSYGFLSETADSSGINPITISSIGNTSSPGYYKTSNSLTINTPVTFSSGNSVIFVNGDLIINKNIIIPKGSGSTAIFSASGSITVDSSVTEIDGLFSADRNFTLNSSSNCPSTGDNQLIIQGSIIANAGRTGGTFINNRTLCGSNSLSPSVKFVERPDFMLNYPSVVIQTTRAWQDSAP